MIERIYGNRYLVMCDNCEDGEEVESWQAAIEYTHENGWKRKVIDGKYHHLCKRCIEAGE